LAEFIDLIEASFEEFDPQRLKISGGYRQAANKCIPALDEPLLINTIKKPFEGLTAEAATIDRSSFSVFLMYSPQNCGRVLRLWHAGYTDVILSLFLDGKQYPIGCSQQACHICCVVWKSANTKTCVELHIKTLFTQIEGIVHL